MATVTIGKSYFEALLRRAEFHTNGSPDPLSANCLVTLTQPEYGELRKQSREYAVLRKALFRGGLTPETLDVLIAGADSDQIQDDDPTFQAWDKVALDRPPPVSVTLTRPTADQLTPDPSEATGNNGFLYSYPRPSCGRNDSFGVDNMSIASPGFNEQYQHESGHRTRPKPPFPQNDQRTILFTNLSDQTTHKDITGIVRGGRLLDVYLRNDRTATVSFVEGAAEFMAYAKRNDIYLHTKRIEVRWNDRQFRLPNHVANKIAVGATRNIVIRGGASKNLSEQGIRDDLEHIHNLIVVTVMFDKGDIYISTNSVHNALFARTCMMSRSLYKGLKIDWYPDECANPIQQGRDRKPSQSSPPQQKTRTQQAYSNNLYALLGVDETDDSESDGDELESQAQSGYDGVGIDWADAVAVA